MVDGAPRLGSATAASAGGGAVKGGGKAAGLPAEQGGPGPYGRPAPPCPAAAPPTCPPVRPPACPPTRNVESGSARACRPRREATGASGQSSGEGGREGDAAGSTPVRSPSPLQPPPSPLAVAESDCPSPPHPLAAAASDARRDAGGDNRGSASQDTRRDSSSSSSSGCDLDSHHGSGRAGRRPVWGRDGTGEEGRGRDTRARGGGWARALSPARLEAPNSTHPPRPCHERGTRWGQPRQPRRRQRRAAGATTMGKRAEVGGGGCVWWSTSVGGTKGRSEEIPTGDKATWKKKRLKEKRQMGSGWLQGWVRPKLLRRRQIPNALGIPLLFNSL